MTYLFLILFTAFITMAFTKTKRRYCIWLGVAIVILAIALSVNSIFFADKVKDAEPIATINAELVDAELGEVYAVEGTVDKLYTCMEYTNNKPQEVRILEVGGVVCKLCPCEDQYVEVGYDVKLKGRSSYTGELNVLKGCYILDVY